MVPESSQLISAPLNPYPPATEESEPPKFGGKSCQDTDETAPVENCDATRLDAERQLNLAQLRSSDRVHE